MQRSNYIERTIGIISCFSFVLMLFLSIQLNAQVIPSELLDSIKNYKIGDDRSNLSEIYKIVIDAKNNQNKNAEVEKELLSFFKSDASFDAKQFVSRELRIVGGESSAKELKIFLNDEKLSDLVRYAIEDIQSPEVDKVLIEALPQGSDRIKIGIINSLGFRKSQNAVDAIAKYINDKNINLSFAAISALGKIANEKCITVLDKNLNVKNESLRNVILNSYLRCADNLLLKKKQIEAYNNYSKIYQLQNAPMSIKKAALTGILNSAPNKEQEILDRIKSSPDELKIVPISKIRDLKNISDINKFSSLLGNLNPANQIQLLGIFSETSNAQVKPSVMSLLNSDVELVRTAAIKTLSKIGDKTDVIKLAKIAVEKSGIEAEAAQNSLDLLSNTDVDKEIITNLNSSNDDLKIVLIKSIGNRGYSAALNTILELTNSDNRLIKNEAFKTIGEIGESKDIGKVIDILKKLQDNSDKRKAEFTISTIMKKSEVSKDISVLLIKELNNTKNVNDKTSFLRLLGQTDDENAYGILVKELGNSNNEIKTAAINGLSLWQNPKPRDILLKTAQTSADDVQSAALKGFTNFIEMDKNLTVDQKVELYKKSLELSKSSNEKNIALDGIGHLDSFESLEVLKSFLNQDDIKEIVDDGINRISWHLFPSDPAKVKEYLNYFLSKVKDEKFQTKNKELLNAIDRYVERNK
ncbi:MAG: HEAT repeat domain-containing protein [Ignavibacteriae bacterium]|nr:HEAT repeat domain-containing protein [Ignavibacteriota bacterium]